MEKRFKLLLLFSSLIHLSLLLLAFFFFSQEKLHLEFKDQKKVSVSLKKIKKEALLKNIKKDNMNNKVNFENHDVNQYREEIKRSVNVENEVKLYVKSSEKQFQYSSIYHKEIKIDEPDLFEDEIIDIEPLEEDNIIEDGKYLDFVEGEERELINDYKDEFYSLDLNYTVNCKVKITIDLNGNVKSAVMVESTGDINKDNKIMAIINKWQFNSSNKLISEAIVELRYLFR